MKITINVDSIDELEPTLKKLSSLNENYPALTAGMEVEFIVGSNQAYNGTDFFNEKERFIKKRKSTSIISKLSPSIKSTIKEMILSGSYTYQDICNYLKTLNVECSITSVCRYAHRVSEENEVRV